MIERCRDPVCSQQGREFFCLLTASDIDDSGAGHAGAYGKKLTQLILAFPDDIGQVRSLESTLYQGLLFKAKSVHYILRDLRGCCCRKRYDRSVRHFPELSDLKVIRTEVVSPLRYAVSLIYNYEADIHLLNIILEKTGTETLR